MITQQKSESSQTSADDHKAAIELSLELLHPHPLVPPSCCALSESLQSSQALIPGTVRGRQFLTSATQGPTDD